MAYSTTGQEPKITNNRQWNHVLPTVIYLCGDIFVSFKKNVANDTPYKSC